MTRTKRLINILQGLIMIVLAGYLLIFPTTSLPLVLGLIGLGMTINGIRTLMYYFSMARYAVGGKAALFFAVFLLDFGAFTLTIADESELAIFLYLMGWYAFSGLVSILRALEAKRYKGSWKMNMAHGIGCVLIALLCVLSIHNIYVLVYIYCGGLIYSACIRIAAAFRRTEIVFIQ